MILPKFPNILFHVQTLSMVEWPTHRSKITNKVLTYRKVHRLWLSCQQHCVQRGRISPSQTCHLRGFQVWLKHWAHDHGPEHTLKGLDSPSNIHPNDLRIGFQLFSPDKTLQWKTVRKKITIWCGQMIYSMLHLLGDNQCKCKRCH